MSDISGVIDCVSTDQVTNSGDYQKGVNKIKHFTSPLSLSLSLSPLSNSLPLPPLHRILHTIVVITKNHGSSAGGKIVPIYYKYFCRMEGGGRRGKRGRREKKEWR